MRELSLFTGAGGGLLASRLLGWRTVCAVEKSDYCHRVLRSRQQDGLLEDFPIYEDIKDFDGAAWSGSCDLVSGGFPCQRFSTAARGRNNAEDLWPEMLRVIGDADPTWVFAENVARCAIEKAARDLRDIGYSTAFCQLSAAQLGAPHIRKRWWLVGHANSNSKPVGPKHVEVARMPQPPKDLWGLGQRRRVRVANGLAHRVDRTRAAGNGQVPAVARNAWRVLSASLVG